MTNEISEFQLHAAEREDPIANQLTRLERIMALYRESHHTRTATGLTETLYDIANREAHVLETLLTPTEDPDAEAGL